MAEVEKVIPCKWCGTPTPHLATEECNRCWELRSRIECDRLLAWNMLGFTDEGRIKSLRNSNSKLMDKVMLQRKELKESRSSGLENSEANTLWSMVNLRIIKLERCRGAKGVEELKRIREKLSRSKG